MVLGTCYNPFKLNVITSPVPTPYLLLSSKTTSLTLRDAAPVPRRGAARALAAELIFFYSGSAVPETSQRGPSQTRTLALELQNIGSKDKTVLGKLRVPLFDKNRVDE